MASLDPRTDSFISLLIDVSGKARPGDINTVSPEAAGQLLHEYAAAHPEMGLVYDGQVLTYGVAPAAVPAAQSDVPVAPVPVPDVAPDDFTQPYADSNPGFPAPATDASAPFPQGAPTYGEASAPYMAEQAAAPVAANPELPAWVFEGAPAESGSVTGAPEAAAYAPPLTEESAVSEAPAHEAVFASNPALEPTAAPEVAGAGYGVPAPPAPGGYYGVQDAAPPEYATASADEYAATAPDYAPQGASATMDYVMTSPAGPEPVAMRINGLWWLAVLFFGAPGAFVAWFVNRGRTGSKTFLWVGIVLIVLSVLLVGAAIMLLRSAAGSIPTPGAIPTPAP